MESKLVKGFFMLDIQSISVAYNHRNVLSDVTMTINAGEILAII